MQISLNLALRRIVEIRWKEMIMFAPTDGRKVGQVQQYW